MKKSQGFTLIEVMIVIAVVGILSAIAIPAYQASATRAKISEALVLTAIPKNIVAEAYIAGGIDALAHSAQIFNTGSIAQRQSKYVSDILISNDGVITVTLAISSAASGLPSDVVGTTIVLTPNINGEKLANTLGNIDWACATYSSNSATSHNLKAEMGSLPTRYAPVECQ